MKRPTTLLELVLAQASMQLSLAVERDVEVIRRRYEDEGMSFLTIALPSLCDALDQGLALGRLTPSMFMGFKPWRRGGRLPALLQGFFRRVFHNDGSLKDDPCIDAIAFIRQVARLFKKVELPCTAARQRRAFERYESNDENVLGRGSRIFSDDALFDIVSGYLWSDLESLSGELYCSPGVFGSGATAERAHFHERHSVVQWPERGEHCFPLSYHTSHREDDYDSFRGVVSVPECSEQPVRVVSVPKTLKTPRIISVEPSYMMLRQQSVAKPLMDWLESGRLGFKSIRFRDQSHNREMALLGSVDGALATIDLKDASDMVSIDLVRRIFKQCPSFLDYLESSRSTRARLPNGKIVQLRKFASMGSALCFPVEAMVFLTIAVYSAFKLSGKRPSRQGITDITAKISVYGDDIIVPSQTAHRLMEDLELYGLKVNHEKSFTTGFFRESCGGDYYKGHDVTPVYVRQWATGKRLSSSELVAYVSLSNQFYMKGQWHVSQRIRDWVEKRIRKPLARTRSPVGVLTWSSVVFDTRLRWDRDRSSFRVFGPALRPQLQDDPVRDIRAGMLVCFGQEYAKQYLGRFPGYGSAYGLQDEPMVRDVLFWDPRSAGKPAEDDGFTGPRSWARRRGHPPAPVFAPGNPGLNHQVEKLGVRDLLTSVRPYTLKTKYRWSPVHETGLSSW